MEGRWRGSAREDGAGGEVAEGGGEAIVKVVVWDAPQRGEVAMAGVLCSHMGADICGNILRAV